MFTKLPPATSGVNAIAAKIPENKNYEDKIIEWNTFRVVKCALNYVYRDIVVQ